MVNILAFDTSTDACSVAIQFEYQCLQRMQIAPRQHAELLLSMIDELLKEHQCRLQDLDIIAFGAGPGSFIGVRIAASVAQALGFAAHLPVVPISTLQAFAQTAYQVHQIENIVAAFDARMGEIYWGAYHLNANLHLQAILGDRLSSPLTLMAELKFPCASPYLLVGNAWQVYRNELEDLLNLGMKIDTEIYPTAKAIIPLATLAYQQGLAIKAIDAQPVYLRNNVTHVPKRSL